PAPSTMIQPGGAATNVALSVPTAVSQPAVPVVAPVVTPDVVDIGRKLQKELSRVGCAVSRIETDGTWGTASREALRSFNERTRSLAIVDKPTRDALEAVRGHKERLCPTSCAPGPDLRGQSCDAKAPQRPRPAARPPPPQQPP